MFVLNCMNWKEKRNRNPQGKPTLKLKSFDKKYHQYILLQQMANCIQIQIQLLSYDTHSRHLKILGTRLQKPKTISVALYVTLSNMRTLQ